MSNYFFAALAAMTIISIFSFIMLAYSLACQIKLFLKAGRSWWEAIIPFYSTWCVVEMAGLPWWFFLLTFIPIVGPFVLLYILVDWLTSYECTILMAIGCILLPIPFMAIVAFSSNHEYIGVG